jgi:Transport protein particle (TRAPP) component
MAPLVGVGVTDSTSGGSSGGDGLDAATHSSLSADGGTLAVSASIFGFLYSEIVQYHQNRVDSINDLERRLEATGYGVGLRVLELLAYRSRDVSSFVCQLCASS